jgi:hypothetical protein
MRYEEHSNTVFGRRKSLQNGSEPHDRQQDATGLQLRCGEKRRGAEKAQDVPRPLLQERNNSMARLWIDAQAPMQTTSEWRHKLGDQLASRPGGHSTQTMLERTHRGTRAILNRLRVDEIESESTVAAQLARVEARCEEGSRNSALTSMSVERRKNPGEEETAEQPGR